MRSKEYLFQLIQAMSKSEKRYFALDAKKSGRLSSRYLALFEALNNMEDYDEEKLKKKFPKNLSSDKAYLYEAILRSMRDYRSPSSKAAQVKERLMDAKFLYERGLYQQSGDRIAEAKMLASDLADHFSLLEISKEEQLSLYDRRVKVDLELIQSLDREKEEILQGVFEELHYNNLYFRLLVEVYKEAHLKDDPSKEAFKKRIPIELLDEKNFPKAPLAQRRFFLCKAFYYRLLGDSEQVYTNLLKAVNWWKEYPTLKSEEFHRYVSDVGNLINTCYDNKKFYPEAQRWLDRLKNEEPGTTYHEQRYVFLTISVSNLLHLLNSGNFEAAKKVLPGIIADMDKFGLKRSIFLLANIVSTYFVLGDYKNCLKWTNQITGLKTGSREDIQRIVRLYKLVCFFETDELDELEAGFRSTLRYFKKVGLVDEMFESQVLNKYLKRIFNAPLNELRASVAEFKTYLESIEQNPKLEKPLGLGEFLIWAERRLKERGK